MTDSNASGALGRLRADHALVALRSYRLDAAGCSDRLLTYRHVGNLLEVLRDFFPEELDVAGTALLQGDEQGNYRNLELTVHELVDRHLFPLCPWARDRMLEDEDAGAFRTVPIPRFFDHEDDLADVFPDLQSSYQLAVALEWGDYDDSFLHEMGLDDETVERLRPIRRADLDGARLRALCARERSPMRTLWVASNIVTRSTDNVFFDGECMCGDCRHTEWSSDSVAYLRAGYAKASGIQRQMAAFAAWLDVDLPSRVERAVALWNRAAKRR